ncbi:MAG: PDGLE domain-containing protein [Micrococcales bacterium]|nr:PDGLE domain-containing protein [Micrococcales bacterium]
MSTEPRQTGSRPSGSRPTERRGLPVRTLVLIGLALSLLLAGVGSYYASSHPDGLEYVAEKTGFGDSAKDSAASDSPLSDYAVRGISDGRLSGGLAGVAGVAAVGALSFGLFMALRCRSSEELGVSEDRSDLERARGADAASGASGADRR